MNLSLTCLIITKDRPASLQRLIDSIAAQSRLPEEVIIVNDGGETPEYETRGLPAVLIENKPGLGSSLARNVGVARAKGDVVLLLDDDVELITNDFIKLGLKHFEEERVGIVFPRKLDVKDHHSRELSFFEESRLTGELHGLRPSHLPDEKGRHLLGPMVSFFRQAAFNQVGGYDSIYGRGRGHSFREESDFQLRVQGDGWEARIAREIFFKHHIQSAGGHGANALKKLFWIGHNQAVFGARHEKFWLPKAIAFAGIELPRYAWGTRSLTSYPAGVLGLTAGIASSLARWPQIKRKKNRRS